MKRSASRKSQPAAPKRPEEISENCLQKHTNQWLRKTYPGLLAFHVPNERKGGIGAGVHFKAMGVLAGVADWLLFPKCGRKIAIELKKEGGKARTGQEAFENAWRWTGGEYFLVDTLAEFQSIVNAVMLFG